MADTPSTLGSVIAFEGHPETVSTQLRLLPKTPQVLVLPGLESYLPAESEKDFDSRKYIKQTHEAIKSRNEAARAFLQGSAGSGKRLVFLNGGTPTAQTICIKAIMKHATNGNRDEAEEIFREAVQNGVAGLAKPSQIQTSKSFRSSRGSQMKVNRRSSSLKDITEESSEAQVDKDGKGAEVQQPGNQDTTGNYTEDDLQHIMQREQLQDPITRAMRAADALDRETESLQPSNELDLTVPAMANENKRPRSNSLPLYGYSDGAGESAPFFVFGAQPEEEIERSTEEEVVEERYVPPIPNFAITHFEPTGEDVVYPGFSDLFAAPGSPRHSDSTPGGFSAQPTPNAHESQTPFSDVFGMRSPSDVVFGEASLLDMRSSARKSVARVRSLDRIYPSSPKLRHISIPEESSGDESDLATPVQVARPQSVMVIADEKDRLSGRLDYIDGPRTIVVKPKRDVIVAVAPVPSQKRRRRRATYVDHGTDAEEVIVTAEPQFEPVLPLSEDFIVYFKDEAPDALLDKYVIAFKEGSYPILAPEVKEKEVKEVETFPGTPDSTSLHKDDAADEEADAEQTPVELTHPADTDEYDPFAYVQPAKNTRLVSSKPVTLVKVQQPPPTPEQTPTPSVTEKEDQFHELKITSSQTAVVVQNSLRSLLSTYLPPEAQEEGQTRFFMLPELDGMWKPVFREESEGTQKPKRRMDQILAVGSQSGVDKAYSSAVISQLERLGIKPNGLSRSGRLDLRYLLANAMQAYMGQLSTLHATDHPPSNSLLATLIMPQLEMYLALHSEIRFLLLEFPPEHIGIVLALQKLVGVDLMKVAQIVDAKSKDLHFTQGGAVKKARSGSLRGSSIRRSSDVSLARANFLLTSAATDLEIAEFISTIWKILASISDFYKPDTPVKKPIEKAPEPVTPEKAPALLTVEKAAEKTEKKRPPPLTSSFSPFPKISEAPKSPLSPAPNTQNFPPPTPTAVPTVPSRPPSIAETTRTYKSFRSKHDRTMSRRPPTGKGDAMSVYTFNPEEDSDYDEEERRLMPIFLQKRQTRKGNSRKALKFLGLA